MNTRPLYQHIASALCAFENCRRSNSLEWKDNHEATIEHLTKEFMPSGSGIDCGTTFDWNQSSCDRQGEGFPHRLVFSFSYHHMNETGMYDGWTEHKAIVRPSLVFGLDLKITGRDRNGIKEYLHDTFMQALTDEVRHDENGFTSLAREKSVAAFKAGIANGSII